MMPKKSVGLRSRLSAGLRGLFNQASYLIKTLRLVWTASHRWTLAWLVLLIIQGVLPAATVYLTRSLVNSLVAVTGAGASWDNARLALIPAALMAGVLLLNELLKSASEWVRAAQSELVQDYVSRLVHQQSILIDYSCYESSEYNDRLEQARDGASNRSLSLLENSGRVLQNSITLLAMAAILFTYGFWLPIILCISALPAFYIVLKMNRRHYHWSQQTTTERRRLHYYELLMTNSWSAAELRLFDFGPYFQSAYQQLRHRLRTERMQLVIIQSLGRFGAGLIALLILGGALAWMGHQALLGAITLGDLALFYQTFNQGQGIIQSLLGNLGQIYSNSLFISNLFDFLNIKPEITNPVQPQPAPTTIEQEIQFCHVSFRYPGSNETVLEDFNLTLPAGKIVAIVGDNGAGKSTLIKLLCRLYDPDSGSVKFDGIDIRHFSVADLRRMITVLFQFPNPYFVTAAQNIALGDPFTTPSRDEIELAAKEAGIHERILRLPQGYNSMLGKWFPEGTDLSGGEWQKIALARAFFRKAQLIILDEPTSAMDPWAEFDWLERFRKIAQDRTALVITHRFTLAMRADIIHVMRMGRIVETGNHDELLALNGLYAQSWQTQMQTNYSDSISNSKQQLMDIE
jgi:ATP-binding cassette, subfamily B, bacterial